MYCSTCGDERVFESPPCPDGHGAECPERACVDCGSAVLVGSPLTAPGRTEPGTESTGTQSTGTESTEPELADTSAIAFDAPATVRAVA